MKRIKQIKCYVIYQQTEKEIADNTNGSTCKYLLYTPDEMEQPKRCRYYEFEADSVEELEDFVRCA